MVRVEDFYAGTPGSKPLRHTGNFFSPRCRRRARSCFAFGLFFLNRAAVGWAVSCSAFGLFFFRFVGNYIQTSGDDVPLGQLSSPDDVIISQL